VADDADHPLGEERALLGGAALHVELGLHLDQRALRLQAAVVQLLGLPARLHQLALVAMPVLGAERGDLVANHTRCRTRDRVQDHRLDLAVGPDEIELHLRDRALALEQQRPVRLVQHLAADGQQLLQLAADELVAAESGPAAERLVDDADRAVGVGDEQPARGVVVELASIHGSGANAGRWRGSDDCAVVVAATR